MLWRISCSLSIVYRALLASKYVQKFNRKKGILFSSHNLCQTSCCLGAQRACEDQLRIALRYAMHQVMHLCSSPPMIPVCHFYSQVLGPVFLAGFDALGERLV
jgi:hypothetical protein